MKITIKDLNEREACVNGVNWFKDNFGTEADVWDVIKKLEEIKDSRDWIGWLFKEYKLTGLCKSWDCDGNLEYEDNYKDGKRHGLCKGWHENGDRAYEDNYKNGKMHGLCKGWNYNGELWYVYDYDNGVLI